jgi:hypothetical protein
MVAGEIREGDWVQMVLTHGMYRQFPYDRVGKVEHVDQERRGCLVRHLTGELLGWSWHELRPFEPSRTQRVRAWADGLTRRAKVWWLLFRWWWWLK